MECFQATFQNRCFLKLLDGHGWNGDWRLKSWSDEANRHHVYEEHRNTQNFVFFLELRTRVSNLWTSESETVKPCAKPYAAGNFHYVQKLTWLCANLVFIRSSSILVANCEVTKLFLEDVNFENVKRFVSIQCDFAYYSLICTTNSLRTWMKVW